MSLKSILNPFTGFLQKIVDEDTIALIVFKAGVADFASLPPSGNTVNDARFTNDTGHLYIWSGSAWTDQGDVIDIGWGAITGSLADQTDLNTELTTAKKGSIEFVIDGGGVEITTGIAGHLEVPAGFTISQVTVIGDQSGSIVVDVKKSTYANFPTTASIVGAGTKPTLSSAQKSQDSTLTSWSTSLTEGDILEFVVDSVTTIEKCLISLKGTKS